MDKLCTIYRAYGGETNRDQFKQGRVSYFDKYKCVSTLLDKDLGGFSNSDVYLVWDGPKNDFYDYLNIFFNFKEIIEINFQHNQKSLNHCFDLIDRIKDNYEYFNLVEDDHCFWPGAHDVLLEGLEAFSPHFVALLDHRHRYIPGNGDIFQPQGGFATKSVHWQIVESTVFSFAFCRQTWETMGAAMRHFNDIGVNAPEDRKFFQSIVNQGYRLFTPAPSYSAHLIESDMPPVRDFKTYMESL